MADILIRDVEMPNSCLDCDVLAHCKHRDPAHSYYFSKMPPECPLFPLPAEHGRLIDGDAVAQEAYRSLLECEKYGNEFQKPFEVLRAIETAKTIVPAEGGGEDA